MHESARNEVLRQQDGTSAGIAGMGGDGVRWRSVRSVRRVKPDVGQEGARMRWDSGGAVI